MKRICSATLVCLLLAACGSNGGHHDGGGGNNTGGGTIAGVPLEGYVLVGSASRTDNLMPLANVTVQAFTLPVGSTPLAATATSPAGRFSFNANTGNGLPKNTTLLLRAVGGGSTVSALVNTGTNGAVKNLVEASHVGALAALTSGGSAVSASLLAQYEQGARIRIGSGGTDYTATANQAAAATLATQVAADVSAGKVVAIAAPTVDQVTASPLSFGSAGGTVHVSLRAVSAAGRPLNATALVASGSPLTVQAVALTANGSTFSGQFTAPANSGVSTAFTYVYLLVNDGVQPLGPAAVYTVTVLPDGNVTLDILTETLVDEPASRQSVDSLLSRMRPVVHRGDTRRTRQVNADQSIRGAHVVVNDVSGVAGDTGNDGLLLLNVPLSAAAKGYLSLTASFNGRVTYTQFLVLPQRQSLAAGDRIEVNLVLATQTQWQSSLATPLGLGTLNYQLSPLTGFFDVLNSVHLTGATAGATYFRPYSSSTRTDDGDFFAANLPAGQVTVTATYADPDVATSSLPYGPLTFTLVAGQVNAVSALTPPSG